MKVATNKPLLYQQISSFCVKYFCSARLGKWYASFKASHNPDRVIRAFFTGVIREIRGEMNRARETKRYEEIHTEYSAVWPVSCLATKLSVWLATRYYGWITYAPASVCTSALLYAYVRNTARL